MGLKNFLHPKCRVIPLFIKSKPDKIVLFLLWKYFSRAGDFGGYSRLNCLKTG